MKVSDLIAKLEEVQKQHGDLDVMQAADPEGNSFSGSFSAEVSFLGQWGDPCHPDDAEDGAKEVVVLWP